MSISKEYWVRCDVCGDMNFPSFTSKQARSEAKKIGGWAYIDGKDYCPRDLPNNACNGRLEAWRKKHVFKSSPPLTQTVRPLRKRKGYEQRRNLEYDCGRKNESTYLVENI